MKCRNESSLIHVKYSGSECIIAIPNGKVLEGELASRKLKLVQAWIEIHEDELMADWELAISGNRVFEITPLRQDVRQSESKSY
ncbi:MAG: DUF4160 domain-containing protein [Armatimonadota bacterium]|nr:DUF4160 domain-containing protein [Armatimonadota bacterium]